MSAIIPKGAIFCLGCLPLVVLLTISGCLSPKKGSVPNQIAVIRSCIGAKDNLPSVMRRRLGQFFIYVDEDQPGDQKVFDSLEALPLELARELSVAPSQKMVKVYIFSDKESFREHLENSYPGLPQRRAYFFAKKRAAGLGEEMQILTMRSERMEQDLRHELTHALLHGAYGTVPLWIDEGIAEYFENEPSCLGLNRAHLEDIQRDWVGGRQPNLGRLESLSQVGQMGREEYRESWAWVYWLMRLHPGGKDLINSYLVDKNHQAKNSGLAQKLLAIQGDYDWEMMEAMSRVGVSEHNGKIPGKISLNP